MCRSRTNNRLCKVSNHCSAQEQLKFEMKACVPFLMRETCFLLENPGHTHKCLYDKDTACKSLIAACNFSQSSNAEHSPHWRCAAQLKRNRRKKKKRGGFHDINVMRTISFCIGKCREGVSFVDARKGKESILEVKLSS